MKGKERRRKKKLTPAPPRNPLDNQALGPRPEGLAALIEGAFQNAVGAASWLIKSHEQHG